MLLQRLGLPQLASARRPAAVHSTAAAEAARRSPPLLTTAASWGDRRLYPHLHIQSRPTCRGLTCEGRGGALVPPGRSVAWLLKDPAAEGARRSTPPATTAASEGNPGGYRHLHLAWRRTRSRSSSCNHLCRGQRRPTVGRRSTCDPASEAARRSMLLPTTAASGRAAERDRHLRCVTHPARRGIQSCSHPPRRQRRPSVGPRQRIMQIAQAPRRSTQRSMARDLTMGFSTSS